MFQFFLFLRAPYLIWMLLLMDWLVETPDLKSIVLSIVIGHTIYFLINVFPKLFFWGRKRPL